MDDLNDIKAIWHSADVESLPTAGEIREMIRQFRSRRLRRKAAFIVLAVSVSLLLLGLLVFERSLAPVTRITDGLILFLWLFLLSKNINSFRRAQRMKDYSNKDFLAYLDRTRQGHIRYYKRTLIVLLSVASVAMLLYAYDLVRQALVPATVAYGFTVASLLYVWLYLRPRQFRKKLRKFEALRARVEKISEQL